MEDDQVVKRTRWFNKSRANFILFNLVLKNIRSKKKKKKKQEARSKKKKK